ncbi:hypothetical protein HN51_063907 [Arachis hypogaea]
MVKVYPHHINNLEFANALVDAFLDINESSTKDSTHKQVASPESIDHFRKDDDASNASSFRNIGYAPSEFPDAKPGSHSICLMFLIFPNLKKLEVLI